MSTASRPPSGRSDIEVRRSRRRTRTVSAFREGGRIVVAIPARFSRAQEREWVDRMVADLERKESRRKPSDTQLARRATELSDRYLGGRPVPASVQWSTRQNKRWGSCTPSDRSIRLSARLQGMPEWVVDYVLLHELNHLLHPNHSAAFWAELAGYPHLERAKAFLDGVSWADRAGAPEGSLDDEPGPITDSRGEGGNSRDEDDEDDDYGGWDDSCARLSEMYRDQPRLRLVDPDEEPGVLW